MKNIQTTFSGIAMVALGLGIVMTTLNAQETAGATPVINWAHIKGGGQIEILGNNFGATKGTVKFSGSNAVVQSWSNTLIQVTSTLNEPITSALVVTTSGNLRATGAVFNPVGTLSTTAISRDNFEAVTLVQINGGTNQAHVAPGASVSVSFGYACSTCSFGIQFGFNTGAPQACIFPISSAGSSSVSLVAPTTPGIYYILFDDNQNGCQAEWDFGTPPVSQAVGTLLVY